MVTDDQLVSAARQGDNDALVQLWRRHHGAAVRYARAHGDPSRAEDLVSEAFTRIIAAVRNEGGPTEVFKSYLFTTIRNVQVSLYRTESRLALQPAEFEGVATMKDGDPEAAAIAATETHSMRSALLSLPVQWQEILWRADVEGLHPAELARRAGMNPGAISALVYRARRGLRAAWIQQHVSVVDASRVCARMLDHFGAYEAGTIAARAGTLFTRHLASCADCSTRVAAARELLGSA